MLVKALGQNTLADLSITYPHLFQLWFVFLVLDLVWNVPKSGAESLPTFIQSQCMVCVLNI